MSPTDAPAPGRLLDDVRYFNHVKPTGAGITIAQLRNLDNDPVLGGVAEILRAINLDHADRYSTPIILRDRTDTFERIKGAITRAAKENRFK